MKNKTFFITANLTQALHVFTSPSFYFMISHPLMFPVLWACGWCIGFCEPHFIGSVKAESEVEPTLAST